ncbi:hypothetical protein pdam_00021911, partial [Pocillopora damicornis]
MEARRRDSEIVKQAEKIRGEGVKYAAGAFREIEPCNEPKKKKKTNKKPKKLGESNKWKAEQPLVKNWYKRRERDSFNLHGRWEDTHLAAQSQWQKLKSFGNVHRTEKPVDTLYAFTRPFIALRLVQALITVCRTEK